ncbi:hypothetical protein Moror_7196 [Moniliophthora roreri MCA 2997]|uniref:Nucleoporin NUP188 n=1 Tax=Moniliophthora roreri (strain MCA 2997) TaxID=1381753 RepID=V2XTN7_MONRO|nr:hypothetical protein Moror_7196 [Moniliophthora roreri MCA 2997]
MSAGKQHERSNLIDVTYSHLHSALAGHIEGTSAEQIKDFISPRIPQLKTAFDAFGKPTDTSRKNVESGSVTLEDGVVLHVEEPDKEFVFAISSAFQIDQVHALVLFRSFLYNQGLPQKSDSDSNASLVEELVEAITPFHFSERLHLLRVFIPLFRAKENPSDPIHSISLDILPKIVPDGQAFAESLLNEYDRKSKEKLPTMVASDPRAASRWAKQSGKEQVVILEVLFWTLWGSVACNGPIVQRVFEAVYSSNLGSEQQNATLLLDEEGTQLTEVRASLWILISIEVLELETVADPSRLEISDNPLNRDFYTSSPSALKCIHELVTSNERPQYACTYLAWTFVISRIASTAMELKEIPPSYQELLETLVPHLCRAYSKDREPAHASMARKCLEPKFGLFHLMLTLLTSSPVFVTSVALKTGSTVTDANAIAFRSVFKGLVIALLELVPVELIPELDAFMDVWVALFGRSEGASVAGICIQFWQSDWQTGAARRALFDLARSRFPVQCRPLIRLLRSMAGSGFLDTDPIATPENPRAIEELRSERELCARYVFHFLDNLPSFTQIIPASACTGAHALFEKQIEQYGTSNSAGLTYTNVAPLVLPGGSTLPAGSKGSLLSGDGGEILVVSWRHKHSGWRLMLDALTAYVNQRHSGSRRGTKSVYSRSKTGQDIKLSLMDIGLEMNGEVDEALVTDILDCIRSLIHDNPTQGEQLMQAFESDSMSLNSDSQSSAPDLVQLTTMILEEALSRLSSHPKIVPPHRLITSTLSVLSAVLAIPGYSPRVWIYIRSTSSLFGSEKHPGYTSATLATERVTGNYTMTIALMDLVQRLCDEASMHVIPDDPQLRKLKDEVLLRAVKFVHTEVWVEHLGWKYARLGDRFELGRRISSLYLKVLRYTPPVVDDSPFVRLSRATLNLLIYKASTSAISPLVSAIASGAQMLKALYDSRRYSDAGSLIALVESHLQLIRLAFHSKCASEVSSIPCLLEQALCGQVTGGAASHDPYRSKINPIDALCFYVRQRDAGQVVPLEAVRVLTILCISLSMSRSFPSSIVGHMSDAESNVSSFVRIVQHPYDEPELRYAIWNFMSVAMDKEPALGGLLVAGQFHMVTDAKGKGKAIESSASHESHTKAIDVACDALANWEQLWEANPQLLASVLRFLYIVWQHGLEHKGSLEKLRSQIDFWKQMSGVGCSELGPIPDFETETYIQVDGRRRSNLHEAVTEHCYRTIAKAFALRIVGLDIGMHLQSQAKDKPPTEAASFRAVEPHLRSQDELTDLLSEATPSSYVPDLYDTLSDLFRDKFPGLKVAQIESKWLPEGREYGDDFFYSAAILHSRLSSHRGDHNKFDDVESAERQLASINLNLSLTHTQASLVEAWQFLLNQVKPYLSGDIAERPILLSIASSISFDLTRERRLGDMVASIHGNRLSLLLSVLELAWFFTSETTAEVRSFIELVNNIRGIVLNEYQPPSKSIQGVCRVPFHRPLLQLIYFCTKSARRLIRRPKALEGDQRQKVSLLVEAALNLVIDGLRVVFIAAASHADDALDQDMELLVAVFEQCTRSDVTPSSSPWLARCQETDVIKASLELYTRIDLLGLNNLQYLSAHKRPPYSCHILSFHMALASIPLAAERLANEGVLSAYSNNSLTGAVSAGLVDEILIELPGLRSPAHQAYCSMLAVVSGVVLIMGRHNHYFDTESCGLVQLFGDQIARSLSWHSGESITFPLLEEIEQTLHLFHSIALNTPSADAHPEAANVMRVFSPLALRLLQQLNYAISHPNHLASLFEPITSEDRALQDQHSPSGDVMKRPLIVHLIHRLFQLSTSIVSTLVCISKADVVLTGDQHDWPLQEALLVPHSKIVLGETASIGTLLELGNSTLDVLRNLCNLPAGQSMIQAQSMAENKSTLDVRQGVMVTRGHLEGVLTYAVTQLAMWLSKPDFDAPSADMETDEQSMDVQKTDLSKDRRAPRSSMALGERMRRGMTGEMAADIQSLLNKAKPVITKSDSILGIGWTDITPILSTFLQDRIISATS